MLDHIGLDVPDIAASRAFHERALKPGYGPNDYTAFVIGPAEFNIEAVCHAEG